MHISLQDLNGQFLRCEVIGYGQALGGGEAVAYNLLERALHLGIALVPAGIGKAYHGAFRDADHLAQTGRGHKDHLVVVFFDKSRDLAMALAQPLAGKVELIHNRLVFFHSGQSSLVPSMPSNRWLLSVKPPTKVQVM